MRNPWEPLRFDHDPDRYPNYIPANPSDVDVRPDISLQRQNAVADVTTTRVWRARDTQAEYDAKTKTLTFHWFANPIDGAIFNKTLSVWWADFAIEKVVMYVSGETAREQFSELKVNGYERCEPRESSGYPALCFVSTKVKQWK